jgi:hypothetical protein
MNSIYLYVVTLRDGKLQMLWMYRMCIKVKVTGIRVFITNDFETPLQMGPLYSEKM